MNTVVDLGAANELAKLAQQEYLNTTISLRASAELLKAPGAVQSSALHLLQYKLKKLKQDNAGAKAEMDAALAVELPENTVNYLGSELLETLAQSGEYARLEQFAMSGGGALSNSDRRQLLHGALNQLGSDAQRAAAIRILRKLLEDQDSNANEDRRQLAERLLEGGELDAALAEIRKFDESANAWNTWHCWERLIDAFNSKGSDERAVDAALEMWGHLKDDENYSWQVLRKLSSTIVTAAKDNFCVSCDSYAAVKIDCFDCHSSKPQSTAMLHPLTAKGAHMKHQMAAQAGKQISAKDMAKVAGDIQ